MANYVGCLDGHGMNASQAKSYRKKETQKKRNKKRDRAKRCPSRQKYLGKIAMQDILLVARCQISAKPSKVLISWMCSNVNEMHLSRKCAYSYEYGLIIVLFFTLFVFAWVTVCTGTPQQGVHIVESTPICAVGYISDTTVWQVKPYKICFRVKLVTNNKKAEEMIKRAL